MTFLEYFDQRDRMDRNLILCHTRTDDNGILHWKINGYIVPPDVIKIAYRQGMPAAQAEANRIASAAQDAAIWAPIFAYVDELKRRRGELPDRSETVSATA